MKTKHILKNEAMKCQVCKINEAKPNSIVCGERCNNIRLEIIRLSNKYTPTNGCDNCLGDLHYGCTDKCKEEFKRAHEFVDELYSFVRMILNRTIKNQNRGNYL